jgi:hypothetical protein
VGGWGGREGALECFDSALSPLWSGLDHPPAL